MYQYIYSSRISVTYQLECCSFCTWGFCVEIIEKILMLRLYILVIDRGKNLLFYLHKYFSSHPPMKKKFSYHFFFLFSQIDKVDVSLRCIVHQERRRKQSSICITKMHVQLFLPFDWLYLLPSARHDKWTNELIICTIIFFKQVRKRKCLFQCTKNYIYVGD